MLTLHLVISAQTGGISRNNNEKTFIIGSDNDYLNVREEALRVW